MKRTIFLGALLSVLAGCSDLPTSPSKNPGLYMAPGTPARPLTRQEQLLLDAAKSSAQNVVWSE